MVVPPFIHRPAAKALCVNMLNAYMPTYVMLILLVMC
jgi:hypothetical protein